MTTPYGSAEPPFDICQLALTAGATHVERWTTTRPQQCKNALKRALQHRGFSLIEILSQCPTHFGRYALQSGSPKVLMDWIDSNTYTEAAVQAMGVEEKMNKLPVGEFLNIQKAVYQGSNHVSKEE